MADLHRRPNILLITTDEQRYDTLGVTGNTIVRTPNLDALASRGTLFTHGYIQNPVCIPSRACIMTGRYVHQHGVDYMEEAVNSTPGLPPWEITIMERLQAAGYRTAGFGKLHMIPPRGLDEMWLTMGKGARWTVSHGSPLGPSQLGPVYAEWLERKRPGAYEQIYEQRRRPEYRAQAGAIVNCLAADEYVDYWIGENTWNYVGRDHDRPWFAWCGFCGPHPPYDPPEPYASLYPIDEMPVPSLLHARQRHVAREDRPSRFDGEDGETLIRRIIAYYWGMMTFIDDMMGRIMDTLTRRGLWENTLVIFTTDHGAMIGDFGQTGKGNFLEQVIRVPYIVVPPGSTPPAPKEALTPNTSPSLGEPETTPRGSPAAGGVRESGALTSALAQGERESPASYDGLVEHVDLVPTILDYAGIPQPAELPGRSLRPILEGRLSDFTPRPFVICEYGGGRSHRSQCLRTARYKYIFRSGDRRFEFYDLAEDPQELVNVAGDPRYAAEIARHAELLIDHRLQTETNAWKCGLAAQTPPALDPFGQTLSQR